MSTATKPSTTKISELRGAKLPVESCRWAIDQQASNVELLLQLGMLTGRCELGIDSYSEKGEPEQWLTLAEVDPAAVEEVLSRLRRKYPEWRLDGQGSTSLEQLDHHFQVAQARRRREG